jgi:protoporphyrinogen oxidase
MAGPHQNRVMHVRTLILGGGMSGLSCAYHLQSDYQLWEKSDEPGGLSRSIKQDGFVYDHTGHLLHLHKPYTTDLIHQLLKGNLAERKRNAWIFSHNTYTRYPFQANLYGLPPQVVEECLQGLYAAQKKAQRRTDKLPKTSGPDHREGETFFNWVEHTFGSGFGRHFFYPYNEKLWTVSPQELTVEWMGNFVPKPSIEDIEKGARSDQTTEFGYNASFFYPRQGGIQALAFAFADKLNAANIHLRKEAASIDLAKKQVTATSGEVVSYDYLVSSLPLARFLEIARLHPPDIADAQKNLRWTSVYNLNLGVARAAISDKHWIYFPEKKYPFYRVGFPMNFSDHMTPPGHSSMYTEIAYKPGHPPNDQETYQQIVEGLYDCGLLNRGDQIVSRCLLQIPIAYVIFDAHYTPSRRTLLDYLQSRQVHSIGRFGAWKYSYMEEAILDGKSTAETIDGAN